MKNGILVFTKVPEAGKTKTRLTIEKGGIFTAEEAKMFYEHCLLDVVEHCLAAQCGDVYLCYNQDGDRGYLEQILGKIAAFDSIAGIFPDQGGDFNEVMQYGADYLLGRGQGPHRTDSILIVGGDMPVLQPVVLQNAARELYRLAQSEAGMRCASLHSGQQEEVGAALVESADQAGGFNVIAYTRTTPFRFTNLFYDRNGGTVLDLVIRKVKENKIPLGMVEMVPDIDLPEDLGGMLPVMHTMQTASLYSQDILSPRWTIDSLQKLQIEAFAEVPEEEVGESPK